MHFVYFIWSKKLKKLYIGETSNLENRLKYHNQGRQRYTKKGVPWQKIAYVTFENKLKALKEERHLKKCKNKNYYKKYILNYAKKW